MRIIKNIRFLIFVVVLIGFFYILACSEGTNPNDLKFVLPDSNVSFADDISPLFSARCGWESGCHSSTDVIPPAGRDYFLTNNILLNAVLLVDYQLWDTGEKLVDLDVDPQNPQSSKLYLILLEGYPVEYDDQMPPPWLKEPLTKNQLNGIKKWIEEGALNN